MAKNFQWYLKNQTSLEKPGPKVYVACSNCGKSNSVTRHYLRKKLKTNKEFFCTKQCCYKFYSKYKLINEIKMWENICPFCKSKFNAKYPTIKYCSPECRRKEFISNKEIKKILNHALWN